MIPNWQAMPYPPHDFMPIVKCARCHKVFGRLECGYNRGDYWFHTKCWHKMNDPERDKTMDDQRRFYVVRLGKGYIKHSQSPYGAVDDWELLEVSLARNAIDAIKYENEDAAQEMATSVGGEVCCFGIYDAKPINEGLASVIDDMTPSSGHRFDWAYQQLLSFRRVRRRGWRDNGKGMWVAIQEPGDTSKMTLPYLYMRTHDGQCVPWAPSPSDILQRDWVSG